MSPATTSRATATRVRVLNPRSPRKPFTFRVLLRCNGYEWAHLQFVGWQGSVWQGQLLLISSGTRLATVQSETKITSRVALGLPCSGGFSANSSGVSKQSQRCASTWIINVRRVGAWLVMVCCANRPWRCSPRATLPALTSAVKYGHVTRSPAWCGEAPLQH